MPKADTVCSFCGVSYLVFSEVKELEKKLIDALADAARVRQLESKLESCEQKHANTLATCSQLTGKVASLETENASLKSRMADTDNLRKEVQHLMDKLSEADKRSKSEQQMHELSNQKIDEARAQVDQATQQAESQLKKCRQTERALNEERSRRLASELLNSKMKRKFEVFQTFLKLERTTLAEIRHEVANSASDSAKCLKAFGEKFEGLSSNFESQLSSLAVENNKLSNEVQTLRHDNKSIAIEHADLERSLADLQRELQTKMRNQTDASAHERKHLSEIISKKDEEIQAAHQHLESLSTNVSCLESQLKEHEKMELKRSEDLKDALLAVQSAEKKCETFKVAMEDMKAEKCSLEIEMRAKEAQMEERHEIDLTRIRSEHTSNFDRQKSTFNTQIHELSLACEAKEKTLAAKLKEFAELQREHKQLRAFATETDLKRKELEKMEEGRKTSYEDLEMKFESKRKECEKLLKTIGELQEQVDRSIVPSDVHEIDKQGLEGLERTLIKLSGQVRQKDKEIQRLQHTVHRQCEERMELLAELNVLRVS